MPLTSDWGGVVCSQGGSWISTRDGPHRGEGGEAEVRQTRARSSINPDARACPGQRAGREPSGSFPCESRFREPRNHKGEDEAVFPEEKRRCLPNAEVRALFCFYLSSDEEKNPTSLWFGIIFSVHASALMRKPCLSFPQPETFQKPPTA